MRGILEKGGFSTPVTYRHSARLNRVHLDQLAHSRLPKKYEGTTFAEDFLVALLADAGCQGDIWDMSYCQYQAYKGTIKGR